MERGSAAAPSAPALQFCSSSNIIIPITGGMGGTANPYPSSINVSGLVGTTSSVTVTLNNLQHFWASDLDILLVAPDGRKFVVMSDVGGSDGFDSPATITLTDAATVGLPSSGAIPSGSYKPTDNDAGDAFPNIGGPYSEPAPAGTATFASVFNGGNPNGTWSLYVYDDSPASGGSITGGWCLNVTSEAPLPGQVQFSSATFNEYAGNTATVTVSRINGTQGPVTVDYAVTNNTATGGTSCGAGIDFITTGGTLSFASGEASKTFNVQLCPDSGPEQGETANLVLSNPTGGATIGSQGISTLVIVPAATTPATQFCRPNPIAISGSGDAGAAAPYPSKIPVTGLNGLISNVKITLNGFRHTWSEDVDILLVSPSGQKLIVLSDIGGSQGFTAPANVTLTDFASAGLPTSSAQILSNAYRPTNVGAGNDFFPTPAPAPPYNSPLPDGSATFASTFNGFDPNGEWSLYVYDDLSGGSGVIQGGWCIDISTTTPQGPGQFGFALQNYTVNEGETANVTVARNNGGAGTVTVNYATTSGSATGGAACAPGVDFINASGTLTFPEGVFTQTIPVQMCLDGDNDPEE
ncbi:MAG: hypothetical protein JO360_17370, partial [Acidobacteria bacterium]|nr:hypothetical protein [Acidobacteriota bacterium]